MSGIANRGALRLFSGSVFRWIAAVLLVSANLPLLFAGILAVFESTGDHEFQMGSCGNRLEITLHHREKHTDHSHTILEKILVGSSASNNEPDHHFGFDRQHTLVEESNLRAQEISDAFTIHLHLIDVPAFGLMTEKFSSDVRPQLDTGGIPPPLRIRRGIVMRV